MSSLLRLSGVIAALMKVYSPFAAILLTCCGIWMLPGLADFEPAQILEATGPVQAVSAASMIPMATGFFAVAGLMGVDWGAASARRRDVFMGGLAGIVLAGAWTAIMSLIVVAGAMARSEGLHLDRAADPTSAPVLSFRWGIIQGLRGWPATVVLCLLGLAALAPACFSSYLFIRKLFARWPGIRRIDWGWIGCTAGFLLVATGWPGRLASVAYGMGLIFAPAVGAMAGDRLHQRGGWAGVRPGIHPIGVAAWGAGMVVRPLLDLLAARGLLPLAPLLASPVAGFAVAAASYVMLARLGLERPAMAVNTFPGGSSEHEVIAMAEVDASVRAPR